MLDQLVFIIIWADLRKNLYQQNCVQSLEVNWMILKSAFISSIPLNIRRYCRLYLDISFFSHFSCQRGVCACVIKVTLYVVLNCPVT